MSNNTNIVLVRFDCGCVGALPNSQGFALLFDACDDRDNDGSALVIRDMSGKTHEPVDLERQKRLLGDIQTERRQARLYRTLHASIRELTAAL